MSLLVVNNLRTEFPMENGVVKAVRDVSFTVESGEVVGIVGESGSGKSVTALSIMRLVESPGEIVAGEVRFDGKDLLRQPAAAMTEIRGKRIGMVFQDPMTSLNPAFSVGNQIAEVVEKHEDASRADARERAIELLERVNIPDAEDRIDEYPHQFSGGMRQRVLIAIALACNPELLIADEPTTALDVTVQAQILELLKELQRDLDLSIVIISHDLGVIAEIADSVVVMYAGQVVEQGDATELFYEPEHPYLRSLLASSPHRAETDESGFLPTIDGKMPDLVDLPSGCIFHPRCPEYIGPVCEEVDPAYYDVGETPGHCAACHLHADDEETAQIHGDESWRDRGRE